MIAIYVAAAIAFALALAGMAIGVIISNRRIRGTCGGLANHAGPDGKPACGLCSNPSPECRSELDARRRAEQAVN